MDIAIELKNISVRSGNTLILDNINCSFPEAASSLITGPSGCGKSLLLKVAAGLIIPDKGDVLYRGKSILKMDRREFFNFQMTNGFVFQDSALWANTNLFGNLDLPLFQKYPKKPVEERRHLIQELTERFDFHTDLLKRPSQISPGEQKLISFLRATITDPELIFMDEPSLSVDRKLAESIAREIKNLKSRKKTIIGISHDKNILEILTDYIVIMKEGRLIQEGWAQDIRKSPKNETKEVIKNLFMDSESIADDILEMITNSD